MPSGTSTPSLSLRSHDTISMPVLSSRVAPVTASTSAAPDLADHAIRSVLRPPGGSPAHRPIVFTNAPFASWIHTATQFRGAYVPPPCLVLNDTDKVGSAVAT